MLEGWRGSALGIGQGPYSADDGRGRRERAAGGAPDSIERPFGAGRERNVGASPCRRRGLHGVLRLVGSAHERGGQELRRRKARGRGARRWTRGLGRLACDVRSCGPGKSGSGGRLRHSRSERRERSCKKISPLARVERARARQRPWVDEAGMAGVRKGFRIFGRREFRPLFWRPFYPCPRWPCREAAGSRWTLGAPRRPSMLLLCTAPWSRHWPVFGPS